jgi:RNA polymerase sigma-70 factor (ECF subfamily)
VDEDRAEEVVQDVFLRLWTRRDWTITTTVRAYLFGAVRHRALNLVHRNNLEARSAELMLRDAAAYDLDDEEDSDDRELRRVLIQAITTFPERQRAAIVLRIERELSYREIGDVLGISATAAGNLVKKAEDKLQRVLQDWRPGLV